MYTIRIAFSPYFQEMNFDIEMSLEQSTTKNIDSVYPVRKKTIMHNHHNSRASPTVINKHKIVKRIHMANKPKNKHNTHVQTRRYYTIRRRDWRNSL